MGSSRQAVSQSRKRQALFDAELNALIPLADLLKDEHPGCGVEKMYYTLQPKFMGRDKFCEIFLSLGYGVKRVKNYSRTTISCDLCYPNLIEGMVVTRPYQVIQSDITYFELGGKFYYLTFIIDVYTRVILGCEMSLDLRAEANLRAMKRALKNMKFEAHEVIHHSDRGSQYTSKAYTSLLKGNDIDVSMGLYAFENPFAERINGIIKNEYLRRWKISNEQNLRAALKKAVDHYNNKRLHRGHGMKYTPQQFLENYLNLNTQKRPTVKIYTDGKEKPKGTSSPNWFYPEEDPRAHFCPIL